MKLFGLGSISGHTSNRVGKMGTSRRASWARGRRMAVKVAQRRKARGK